MSKSEIRSTKFETRASGTPYPRVAGRGISVAAFSSDFVLRISDFPHSGLRWNSPGGKVPYPRRGRFHVGAAPAPFPPGLPMPNLHTPLYQWHAHHKARVVPFAEWDMPVQYAGIVPEHKAIRTAAVGFVV